MCVLAVLSTFGMARTRKSSHKATSRSVSSHSSAKAKRSSKRSSSSSDRSKSRKSKRASTAKVVRSRGQQTIENDRAREIQEALIRAKYMDGEPSGVWDQETKSALTRFQADNGWQSKVVPDSRALIKLGLGPDHSNALNPQTSSVQPAQSLGADAGALARAQ